MPTKGRGKSAQKENVQAINQRQNRIRKNAELALDAQRKAQATIISLLENNVSEDDLRKKILLISPENFEDVAVERAITGICGYPLCKSFIQQTLGDQTYIIRQNKVYDITQRKNFCSNRCYEAYELVHYQVPNVPLYLRGTDEEIQNLKLCIPDVSTLKGKYGKFVSITAFDEALLHQSNKKAGKKKSPPKVSPQSDTSDTPNSTGNSLDMTCSELSATTISTSNDSSNPSELSTISKDSFIKDSSGVSFSDLDAYLSEESQKLSLHDHEEEPFEEVKPAFRSDGKKLISKEPTQENLKKDSNLEQIYQVELAMREWMTFESLRMILGDNYVRGMLEHLGETWEDYDTTAGLRLGVESKSKFISLCKKLDREETKEKVLESKEKLPEADDENDEEKMESSPVPDYIRLLKDVQKTSLKVKAFYEGNGEVVSTEEPLQTIHEEGDDQEEKKEKGEKSKTKSLKAEAEDAFRTLPLIDTYSQNTWRRQIVQEKLGQTLSRCVLEMGLDESQIRRLCVSLIATFDLSPRNIVFHTDQWSLVALVLMKMLSVRYPVIEEAMTPGGRGFKLVTSYLVGSGLDPDYLNRLLSFLTEISYILTKYHKDPYNSGPLEQVLNLQGPEILQEKYEESTPTSSEEPLKVDKLGSESLSKGEKTDLSKEADELVPSNVCAEPCEDVELGEEKKSTNYEELD